jgi:hypothetical protein
VSSTSAQRGWWGRFGSRLFLLAVLAAFVGVQDPTAALHEHSHCAEHSPGQNDAGHHHHCCAACHSGLFLAMPAPALAVPFVASAAWSLPAAAQSNPGNALLLTRSSRAPPASSALS